MIADSVTPVTQGVTVAIAAGFFTLVTLLITNRSRRQTETASIAAATAATTAATKATAAAEVARIQEKEDDRQAAIDKEARDYARQDLVAERVERATLLTMRKLGDVEELAVVTHALVNSDKTAQMKDQRDGWKVTLALMREVISLKEDQGKSASEESLSAINELESRIVTLDSSISDRLAQQLAAEQRVALDQKQAGASLEAADRQIAAAQAQQLAADSQGAAATKMSEVLDAAASQQIDSAD